MDFSYSARTLDLMKQVDDFMQTHVFPAEAEFDEFTEDPANRWVVPPLLEGLKARAKAAGLWNLFMPHEYGRFSPGLTNLEYAPLAELMGRVEWAPEVFNCSAPDTGNMEVLAKYGSEAQQERWLKPLLDGKIRSAYLMTEPQVASSDATNLECSIVRDGDEYVINGRKWWSTGAYDPRCELTLVMGKTRSDGPRHAQHSTIIVPMKIPGVRLVRPLKVFGELHSPGGHGEVALENVRVPVTNLVLGEGRGFEIAQGRLGPGRIHHCMRLIGAAQRSLDLMCRRVDSRVAFGRKLSEQSSIRQDIARSRCEIEQARLLTLAAADKMDREGNKGAKDLISMIKIVAPQMCQNVADRAIQAFGGMGLCQDTPIPAAFAYGRYVRLADGPDAVHMGQLAKWTIAAA
ncbi:MAG: acyl-CoA dehydrogenase, partial [Gammaproteobacteria bacterium]|nr:acyl-CoA dehydrogenase [Gammaproteobacteria bacterium]